MPPVVPGLATGSSSPSSSSPQDESDNIPSSRATQRSDDMNVPASRNRSRNPINSKTKTKTATVYQLREINCEICQIGQWRSQKISKKKKYQHSGTHPPTLLEIQSRNVLPKWYRAGTAFLLTSRKIEIARFA